MTDKLKKKKRLTRGKARQDYRRMESELKKMKKFIVDFDKAGKAEIVKLVGFIRELEDEVEALTGIRPNKLGIDTEVDKQAKIDAYDAMPPVEKSGPRLIVALKPEDIAKWNPEEPTDD